MEEITTTHRERVYEVDPVAWPLWSTSTQQSFFCIPPARSPSSRGQYCTFSPAETVCGDSRHIAWGEVEQMR